MSASRPTVLVAAVLLAGLLLFAGSPPANAEDQLQVSRDGTSWSASLNDPLFDPSRRWVPGDGTETSFWVKNVAPTTGRLSITIDTDSDAPLIASGVLRIAVRSADTDWVDVAKARVPQRLRIELGPEQKREIFVRARLVPQTGNEHQDQQASLRVRATLTDLSGEPSEPSPTGVPSDEPGDDDGLPNTGAPAGLWLVPVGAAACGCAAALLRRGRRGQRGQRGQHDG